MCECNGTLSHLAALWGVGACLRSPKAAKDQLIVVSQQSLGDLSVTPRKRGNICGWSRVVGLLGEGVVGTRQQFPTIGRPSVKQVTESLPCGPHTPFSFEPQLPEGAASFRVPHSQTG